MAQDRRETWKQLTALAKRTDLPELDVNGKYAMISDVHLGNGGGADDFRDNEETLTTALEYYRKNGFTLLLLGDIEELWQFDLDKIADRYRDSVYKKIRAFGAGNMYRIFGNHDRDWGTLDDPATNQPARAGVAEVAVRLVDAAGKTRVLMLHGHQGSTESDRDSWFSKFFVRLYSYVEPVIKFDKPGSATKSQITKDYEAIMYEWAKKNGVMLICGHSHRAIFASLSYLDRLETEMHEIGAKLRTGTFTEDETKKKLKEMERLRKIVADERQKGRDIEPVESHGEPKPCYFNTGCALYTDGITAIEIQNDRIRLIKWHKDRTKKPRWQEYQAGSFSDYLNQCEG